ncbi:MAG: cyclic nucleotide-binding domain-containing protein, partial [Planctomycetaceae bacterium]|nr:cyclic nucleotide-binding domain-containing protein [Planctomycetaceae bacterium]
MDVIPLLKQLPFFADLSDDLLGQVVATGRTRMLSAGEVVFHKGDLPDGLYVLLDGKVRVFLTDEQGQHDVELAILSTGSLFGEMALLDGEPRSANVACVEPSRCLWLSRDEFLALLRSSSGLLESLLADLSRRVRGTQEKFYWEMLRRQRLQSDMELERHRSLSVLVAGVAHEINTPLGIVNSATDLMSELVQQITASIGDTLSLRSLCDDLRESASLVQGNIARACQLIKRFKTLSTQQVSEARQRVNLPDSVQDTLSLYSIQGRRAGIEVVFQSRLSGPPEWDGYPGYLSQILLNLLTNAERYAYPAGTGGRVEVELSDRGLGDARRFDLIVRDFGRGIPTESQSRVFEPFFTTGRDQGG